MEVAFTDDAKVDLNYWKDHNNPKIKERISQLILSIRQHPFKGIGKPEPLKHNLSGMWSRRIDSGNRLVYEVSKERITIHGLRGHYKKR
ncbi:MAG: Txe/YoeB family addiction module toxin [Mucilaginibacter sp.]|uniref:Txe/YoeB family addiction module toxin n=1 Tax=Mucilaginibacter sp. TaxID=1882438 RepID=UPI003266838F